MPLDGPLKAINVWALADGDQGWTIVDSGIRSEGTRAAWQAASADALGGLPVKRVILTHMHADHSGMVGWLNRQYASSLWMTRLEYYTLRMLASDTGAAPEDAVDFYRRAGMDDAWLDSYRVRFGSYGSRLYPLPVSFHALEDGDVVRIGDTDWQCVVGKGHSPEHACLWSPDRKLLISGDQILPTISSNVSVHPYEPDADPLGAWLRSLIRIKDIVPDDTLVLPAHGAPFWGLHGRIQHLIDGHEAGLARLFDALEEPKRAVDVFSVLFRRVSPDEFTQMLAVGEAIAHLACLKARGLAHMSITHGVAWWQRAA